MHTTTQPLTANALGMALREAGFTFGKPPHVTAAAAAIDRAVCRKMKCPGCGCRGLLCQPWQRAGSYRVLAVCGACGAGEEL